MAHLTKDPTNQERWVCFFPTYIDATKTIPEGRKLPVEKCVENPEIKEVEEVMKQKKTALTFRFEQKVYSREYMQRFRLRVQLFNKDGTPCNPEIPSRKALMIYIAEKIKNLDSRLQAKKAAATAAQDKSAPASSSNTPTKKGGKKGKK